MNENTSHDDDYDDDDCYYKSRFFCATSACEIFATKLAISSEITQGESGNRFEEEEEGTSQVRVITSYLTCIANTLSATCLHSTSFGNLIIWSMTRVNYSHCLVIQIILIM